jgi:outer membrane murein-binding lipoprotein Lpp
MIWVMRLTLVLMLAGCASTPIVDQAGVDQEALRRRSQRMSVLRRSG